MLPLALISFLEDTCAELLITWKSLTSRKRVAPPFALLASKFQHDFFYYYIGYMIFFIKFMRNGLIKVLHIDTGWLSESLVFIRL